jgi:hypothetical protein
MYFDEWPVRQPALYFGGRALNEPSYLALWAKLNPDPSVEEVIRNYFIRQPMLWHHGTKNEERRARNGTQNGT